jgi:hypothetical protein
VRMVGRGGGGGWRLSTHAPALLNQLEGCEWAHMT